MLSSSGPHGDAARLAQLGILAHLAKPVAPGELLRAIVSVLSADDSQRPADARPATPVLVAAAPAPRRILLAEDNLVNRQLALAVLERRGHLVTIARNGREALERLREASFDLVLMDFQMPEMGGLEATALIRAAELLTGAHLPIFAMTAHAMKGDRERCLAADMDGYISKPINRKELIDHGRGRAPDRRRR